MLKALVQENETSWKDHLNKLVYAYNCTKHLTIGYSPFYLLFERNPRLTVDLLLTHDTDETQHQTLYIDKWKKAMEEAYNVAAERSSRRKEQDVKRRQRKIPSHTILQPGDRVSVCNLSERGGTGKIRSYWQPEIHKVFEGMGDLPVTYKIQPEHNPKAKV